MAEANGASYKQLNCPICLETFESPKVLACLHTFCEKCICRHVHSMRVEGTRSDTILCPVCRRPTAAPTTDQTTDDWAAKLPINGIVVSFLALYQPNEDDSVYCQPCLTLTRRNISVAYCVTCSEYLCSNCYSCHKIFKVSKDHTITVQSMPSQQNLNSIQQDMYRCSMHRKRYKYLCSEHKELCCCDCAYKDHRKCDKLMTINDMPKPTEEDLDFMHISENLDELKKLFITLLESRLRNLESIEQQRIEITKSIKEWTVMIKQFIDKLENAALEELDQMCKQETVTISDEITECKSAIAAIETSERMLIDGTKLGDERTVFITMIKVSQQVLKYKEKYNTKETKSEVVELEFHRDSVFEGIDKTLNSLGKMSRRVCKIPKLSPGSSFATGEKFPPKIQPISMVTISAKIPSDEVDCLIYSGVFLPDDRLVLADVANGKLKLLDQSFHCISSLKMDNPKQVCRVNDSTVAVTSEENINLVSVGNTLTPLRSIHTSLCQGITSYQQDIIVYMSGFPDVFLVYDSSDEIARGIELCDLSGREYNMHCVSPDGQNIYYTKDNLIVTMDMEGNKLNAFESNDLEGASGITVDKNGIIYCCGSDSKTVVQVTPEGRPLGVLLSSDDGLQNPLGISLSDRNDLILVCEGNTNEVKVYRLMIT